MAIPKFSATDHYEFKKWATALRDRLMKALQDLHDVLDDNTAKRVTLEKRLGAAEAELSTLNEALAKLPPNLAGMLHGYTDEHVEDIAQVTPKVRKRLKD